MFGEEGEGDSGGFGVFRDGVTIRTVISIFQNFPVLHKKTCLLFTFAQNINNSGCTSTLNEKVTK